MNSRLLDSCPMQRRFEALGDRTFDLAVIGGGITGAMVAWEAATRGLSVALVEQADFCSATSAFNSRLIHGGLRYLRQGQLRVVRESLAERRYWLTAAPHQVRPLAFVLPTHSFSADALLRLGIGIYDLLALPSPLPRSRHLLPDEVRRTLPLLAGLDLTGAVQYHDCQMPMPERIALSALQGVDQRGGCVVNRARAAGLLRDGRHVRGVDVVDELTGRSVELRSQRVINATGAWAAQILPAAQRHALQVLHSAGIHLVTRALTPPESALAMKAADRHFFILPWRGHSLIGTTDDRYDGDPGDYRPDPRAIDSLLASVNGALPTLKLSSSDILHCYGGLRTLMLPEDGDTYRASRRSQLIDHAAANLAGLYSVVGGKWTTSRRLAQQTIDQVMPGTRSVSRQLPLPTAGVVEPAALAAAAPDLRDELLLLYGSAAPDVLDRADDRSLLEAPRPLIAAQARHAARHEMALCLRDVTHRRTGIGLLGPVSPATARALATAMGSELGWDEGRIEAEVAGVNREPA